MFKYGYDEREMDACDVSDAQMEYLFALACVGACAKFGR